jgi:glyoxylase-like metal-dependent hydrolase (beta-lactamase superfamily II)
MLIETLAVGPFVMNAYLVADEESRDAALIDPGDETDRILARIEELELRPRMILNTHGHLDHVTGVQAVKERTGLPFYLHPEDRFLVESLAQHAAMFGLPAATPPEVDRDLADGDVLRVGALEIEVLHTPGHSPGSVSFHVASEKAVFCGDVLFEGSIGRTDLPRGSLDVLLRSIRERLFPLGDDVVVYPGHGPATTIGQERRTNPFLVGHPAD